MQNYIQKFAPVLLIIVFMIGCSTGVFAQGPEGKNFGFGLILGDPTGGTLKIWLQHEQALDLYIGGDYFGGPRIGGDYLWHFFPFNSDIANMYGGVGGTIGVGDGGGYWYGDNHGWFYRADGNAGIGVRAILGVDVTPRRTPLEFFCELGPMFGISPGTGVGLDFALGLRFYP